MFIHRVETFLAWLWLAKVRGLGYDGTTIKRDLCIQWWVMAIRVQTAPATEVAAATELQERSLVGGNLLELWVRRLLDWRSGLDFC
jgi:hypothetical protein